ncbi:MAG: DUF327 family protein [Candidatus Rifleibacteriota bacterium]
MPVKISNNSIESRKTPGQKLAGASRNEEKPFVGKMKEARVQLLSNDLDELAKIAKSRGEAFFKGPEEGLLNSYKESIRQFLAKLTRDFLSLKEEFGAPHDGEQKVFQLVNSIESEVESLTRETLTQNKSVTLLASLDDVRGLVLDIMG